MSLPVCDNVVDCKLCQHCDLEIFHKEGTHYAPGGHAQVKLICRNGAGVYMGSRRHGQGGHFPLEMLKSDMVSKTSLNDVFMHHFDTMSSADPTRELPLDPAGDFRPSDPTLPPPHKKSYGRRFQKEDT